MRRLRLGTRGSRLALIQAAILTARLETLGVQVEQVPMKTEGDLRAPDTTPGEGVFVAAITRALLEGEVDLAVHSAKDVPLDEPDGLIAVYPERADARDAIAARPDTWSAAGLPRGSSVGSDSPRRKGFLLALRPDLEVRPLHGNVDTRLKRLDRHEVDALVLAAAGLDRLGLGARAARRFRPSELPPAPAQGALAVQARRTDKEAVRLLEAIDAPEVRLAVIAERAVLSGTGGGCKAPVGAYARLRAGSLFLIAAAVDEEGGNVRFVREVLPADVESARRLACEAGRRLREPSATGLNHKGARRWPKSSPS
jgi:hydroxymethylbilane synthase